MIAERTTLATIPKEAIETDSKISEALIDKTKISPKMLMDNEKEFGIFGSQESIAKIKLNNEVYTSTDSDIELVDMENIQYKEKQEENVSDEANTKENSDEQIKKVLEAYPPEVIEKILPYINSIEEAELYVKLGLQPIEINGRILLINPSQIDLEQIDADGLSNKERMEKGYAPLDKNGKPFNFHHIGQKADSPLALLTQDDHFANYGILHDRTNSTEVHGKGSKWGKERGEIWKTMAGVLSDTNHNN